MLDGGFICFSDAGVVLGRHLQIHQVEPGIVVERVLRNQLAVVDPPLIEDDVVDLVLVSELLLEAQVLLIQLESLILRDVLQPEPEDFSCPLVFLVLNLELGELDEILLL